MEELSSTSDSTISPQKYAAMKSLKDNLEKVLNDGEMLYEFVKLIQETTWSFEDIAGEVFFKYNYDTRGYSSDHWRNITGGIWKKALEKEIITEEEYSRAIQMRKSQGGKVAIQKIQKELGLRPLTIQEKNFLEKISSDPGYKRGTNRAIQKIAQEMFELTGIQRTTMYIESLMRQRFTQERKVVTVWTPEEKTFVNDMFDKYYQPNKKLPLEDIFHQYQKKFPDSIRTKEAIATYMTDLKPEKMLNHTQIWTEEEDRFIKAIKNNPEYIHKEGKNKGGYKISEIHILYQQKFPASTRTIKSLKHRLGNFDL